MVLCRVHKNHSFYKLFLSLLHSKFESNINSMQEHALVLVLSSDTHRLGTTSKRSWDFPSFVQQFHLLNCVPWCCDFSINNADDAPSQFPFVEGVAILREVVSKLPSRIYNAQEKFNCFNTCIILILHLIIYFKAVQPSKVLFQQPFSSIARFM